MKVYILCILITICLCIPLGNSDRVEVDDNVVIPFSQFTAEEEEFVFTEEYIYLAKCIEAEAGNQGYLGKVYVCDVILNRVDSPNFHNSITEVINAPNQFSVVDNGMINSISVSEETLEVVKNEIENRTNTEILYFRTGYYHSFATPVLQHNAHYFSK